MSNESTQYLVNCPSWQSAQTLADNLLEKGLATSVEILHTSTSDLLEGKGLRLIIDTKFNNLADAISQELKQLLKSGSAEVQLIA
jgi:uncharacterized protein involved in tolerance to divalent cations